MDSERTWKNQEDEVDTKYYFIDHLCPQKRLRVWAGQQMNEILGALTPRNYLTELVRFIKGCDNLSRCYPLHEDLHHVDEIRIDFWAKYQYKIKTIIKPAIKRRHKAQIRKDLKRMGFL